MDTIHDLYTFAAKHRIEMRDALSRAGLGPNWASRARSGRTTSPSAEKFKRLRRALFEIAGENGTLPTGVTPDSAGQIGAFDLVRSDIAVIRERLASIELSIGGGE